MIYLDNNATTRVADEVVAAMSPYYTAVYGNAHAAHRLGRRAHDAVEAARADVAALVGAETEEVVFTSCGTEGNALVIRGLIDAPHERTKIVTTAVEHPSVLTLLRALEQRGLIELATVGVDSSGAIDLDAMASAIDDRTLLVTVMLAQNETGVIHPIAKIAEMAHGRGALVHVDAVQAAGKIAVDVRALDADFLTISGHKFHAPKGVGALAIRRGLKLTPLWYGGGQELGLRSGTEPVPSIVGTGVAARLARKHLGDFDRVRALRDRFESSLSGVEIHGSSQPRLLNTSNLTIDGIDASAVLRVLDDAEICVSGGGACFSGKTEPTATMRAMGKPAAVRFSMSRFTTDEEVDATLSVLAALH